jgi:hypothetical protein
MEHPAVLQHVDAASVQGALERLLACRYASCFSGHWIAGMAQVVIEMPAAAQLSSSAVEQLLHAAVKCGPPTVVKALVALPSAQQLSSSTVAGLLQLSLRQHDAGCTHELYQLPAAGQLKQRHGCGPVADSIAVAQ